MQEQQPQNSEIPARIGDELVRDANGRVVSGVLNPNGRPQGSLDFRTKWLRFIDKVAKQNNLTTDEVDEQLLAVAFKQAKDASYPFFRDIHDRIYGQAKSNVELSGTMTIANVLKEIENEPAIKQGVASAEPVLDTGQEEKPDKVPAQQSTGTLQPAQVVEKYNPQE